MTGLFFVQKWRFSFKHLPILQKTIFLQSRTCRKNTRCRRMASVPPFWDICQWQNVPGILNTWQNTSSKRFFLLPFLQFKKMVLPLKVISTMEQSYSQFSSENSQYFVSDNLTCEIWDNLPQRNFFTCNRLKAIMFEIFILLTSPRIR